MQLFLDKFNVNVKHPSQLAKLRHPVCMAWVQSFHLFSDLQTICRNNDRLLSRTYFDSRCCLHAPKQSQHLEPSHK